MIWMTLLGCSAPLLTSAASAELGHRLCEIGHPHATCGQGRQVDWSSGGWTNKDKKERWLDIEVPYERKGENHTMVIRVRLKQISPCKVAVDVQSDDGPNPVLLDNPITSGIVGEEICSTLTP